MEITVKPVLESLRAALVPLGFRRRNLLFFKEADDLVYLVQLQKSVSTTKAELIVTANIGILSKPLLQLQEKPLRFTYSSEWHWNDRIGAVMPKQSDYWWHATDEESLTRISEEITAAILQYGLPPIEEYKSTDDLLKYWQTGEARGLNEFLRNKYVNLLTRKPDDMDDSGQPFSFLRYYNKLHTSE